ncbi:MAG: hypothetical protein U9R69_06845 [Thermodesulfobacteriota bacterium]|nr:hypothetical protein [Thermodesulfobacteriota bacterium]
MYKIPVNTKTILIAGKRPEIGKLFELLIQHQERQFVRAKNLEQCFDLAIKTAPDLIIVDCSMAKISDCYDTVVALRGLSETSTVPIFLIDDPTQGDEDTGSLLDIVDGVFSEPFNPAEIKKMAVKYI